MLSGYSISFAIYKDSNPALMQVQIPLGHNMMIPYSRDYIALDCNIALPKCLLENEL